jgi:amino acid permease
LNFSFLFVSKYLNYFFIIPFFLFIRVRTLEDLAQCAFGPNGFILVCLFQMLFSFSLMCITMDIFAEIMTDVFTETSISAGILTHRRGQVMIGCVLILPLCILKKSMSSLRWTSYFTVLVVAAAILGVVTTYVTDVDIADQASMKRVFTPKYDSAWSAILIVLFCYSYNQKVFMIYSCLRRRSSDRWGVAVRRANMWISLLYIGEF